MRLVVPRRTFAVRFEQDSACRLPHTCTAARGDAPRTSSAKTDVSYAAGRMNGRGGYRYVLLDFSVSRVDVENGITPRNEHKVSF